MIKKITLVLLSTFIFFFCGCFIDDENTAEVFTTPVVDIVSGTYEGNQTVTISMNSKADGIIYSINGADPVIGPPLNGIFISGPGPKQETIDITSTCTLKAVSFIDNGEGDYTYSDISVTDITVLNTVSVPVFSPGPGRYTETIYTQITSATPGSYIRYTIGDGTQAAPTCSTGTTYSSAIYITCNSIIKAIACNGDDKSMVSEGTFQLSW